MNYITAQLFSEHIYRVKIWKTLGMRLLKTFEVNFEDHVGHEDHESHVVHEVLEVHVVHVIHKALENVTERHLNF